MWLDNRFTGIGLNNFEFVCENLENYKLNSKNYGECSAHPHNFYLHWLTEGGILVFLLFIRDPTPSARSNINTAAEHLQNICVNRAPHSRSCWLILALLVAMLALLVASLSLLLAIFSPTCPKMFRNRPRQSPRCLRHLFRASRKCKKLVKT